MAFSCFKQSVMDYNEVADKFKLCSCDYNTLGNKPTINGITLQGDMTSDDLGFEQYVVACSECFQECCVKPYVECCISDMCSYVDTNISEMQSTVDTCVCCMQDFVTCCTEDTKAYACCCAEYAIETATECVDTCICGVCDYVTDCMACMCCTLDTCVDSMCTFVACCVESMCCYVDSNVEALQDYVDTHVDGIWDLIPEQATCTNKLADKEFVNSSIGTNTAHYISDDGEPFTSLAALEAYSGTVTQNDYAFVTGTDAQGNTYFDRYKATVTGTSVTWGKEYRLNNSSFTAVQWAAIQSGITASKITEIDGKFTQNTNDHSSMQSNITQLLSDALQSHLPIGQMGLTIENSLDNYTQVGMYSTATSQGTPTSDTYYGTLCVFKGKYNALVTQFLTSNKGNWIRRKIEIGWQGWERLISPDYVSKFYTFDPSSDFTTVIYSVFDNHPITDAVTNFIVYIGSLYACTGLIYGDRRYGYIEVTSYNGTQKWRLSVNNGVKTFTQIVSTEQTYSGTLSGAEGTTVTAEYEAYKIGKMVTLKFKFSGNLVNNATYRFSVPNDLRPSVYTPFTFTSNLYQSNELQNSFCPSELRSASGGADYNILVKITNFAGGNATVYGSVTYYTN